MLRTKRQEINKVELLAFVIVKQIWKQHTVSFLRLKSILIKTSFAVESIAL